MGTNITTTNDEHITGWRSRAVYAQVVRAGKEGMTDSEVQRALMIGHGASSAALTRLHQQGHIARLAERRNRNEVYVATEFIDDRPTIEYRPNTSGQSIRKENEELRDRMARSREVLEAGPSVKSVRMALDIIDGVI